MSVPAAPGGGQQGTGALGPCVRGGRRGTGALGPCVRAGRLMACPPSGPGQCADARGHGTHLGQRGRPGAPAALPALGGVAATDGRRDPEHADLPAVPAGGCDTPGRGRPGRASHPPSCSDSLALACRLWACSVQPWPQASWAPSCASLGCPRRLWRLPTRAVSTWGVRVFLLDSECPPRPCWTLANGQVCGGHMSQGKVGSGWSGHCGPSQLTPCPRLACLPCRCGSIRQSNAEQCQAGAQGGRCKGQERRGGGHEPRLSYSAP